MSPLRARVENGHIILNEPTTLPEGTVIDLVADDEGDDLTDEERRVLHAALSASWTSAEAGQLRPASEILDEFASATVNRPVSTTPDADTRIRTVDAWWRENRLASPDLLLDELSNAFDIRTQAPEIGRFVPSLGVRSCLSCTIPIVHCQPSWITRHR